jgi:hypothetical protein
MTTYVRIPDSKVDVVKADECERWLVNETLGAVQGYVIDGQYFLRFEVEGDAELFRARWLTRVC